MDQRWYSSGTGRFLTPDPYAGASKVEDPRSWNRYGYALNDPVTYFDPTGLQAEGPPADPKDYCQLYPYHPECGLGESRTGGGTAPPPEGKITNFDRIREEALRYQDAVNRGVYTDCEALAYFANWASQEVEPHLFTDSFRVFYPESFGGIGNGVSLQRSEDRPSGFQNRYQNNYPFRSDSSRNADQTHHFAAFFGIGTTFQYMEAGDALSAVVVAAIAWEFGNLTFRNIGDIDLGIAGGMMGYGVAVGAIKPAELGHKIRTELCVPKL